MLRGELGWVALITFHFPKQPTLHRPIPTVVDQAKVEQAKQLWRQSKDCRGEGNARFYDFARALKSAGMNLEQIEATLKQEYVHARSPPERKGHIPGIMKSLGKVGKVA
jgi:hypothetical protein